MPNSEIPTVLITGAKSGIGLEFARQYAERGWNVIATHYQADPPELLREAMSVYERITYEVLDVSDLQSIRTLAGKLHGQPIDVLVSNAGIAYDGSESGLERQTFGTLDPAAFQRMYAVNVLGPLLVSQEFADNLRLGTQRKLVAISSTNGSLTNVLPGFGSVYYKSSKAGLNRAMICAAEALEGDGIAVLILHPGAVLTEKNREFGAGDYPGLIETPQSVSGMIEVVDRHGIADSGQFFQWDGSVAPW